MEWMQILASVAIGAVSGFAAAALRSRALNRKDDASATATITQAAGDVVSLLSTEVERLSAEVSRLRVLTQVLEEEIVSLGGDPKRLRAEVTRRLERFDPPEGAPV